MADITRKQKKPTIPDAQLELMLERYAATLDAGARMRDPDTTDRELELARGAVDAALAALRRGEGADARHMTGFVQGVLLCKGIHTWEYLASEDTRK